MLHGTISKNGTGIGRWTAKRVASALDEINTYAWEAWTDTQRVTGDVQHQYADGALLLAQKVLVAAHKALAADPEARRDGTVLWDEQMRADAERRFEGMIRPPSKPMPIHLSGAGSWPVCGATSDGSGVLTVADRSMVTCPVCLAIEEPVEAEEPWDVNVLLVDALATVLLRVVAGGSPQDPSVRRVLARYDEMKRNQAALAHAKKGRT